MPSTKLFRVFILANIALTVASAVSGLVMTKTLPDALLAYRQSLEEAVFTTQGLALGGLGLILLVVQVVAWVGLLRLRNFGRYLLLLAWLLELPFSLLAGPLVVDSFTHALDFAAGATTGALLALAFFSPLRHRFGEVATERAPAQSAGGAEKSSTGSDADATTEDRDRAET